VRRWLCLAVGKAVSSRLCRWLGSAFVTSEGIQEARRRARTEGLAQNQTESVPARHSHRLTSSGIAVRKRVTVCFGYWLCWLPHKPSPGRERYQQGSQFRD